MVTPPPVMSLSQWADAKRVLSPESNPAEYGQWHTSRAEYQRGIMDAISTDGIYKVVFLKSARTGATSILENIIGFHIDYDPCPMLMVQPTVEDARDWSKDNLTPMLRDTPCLQNKVSESKARNSDNTIQHKIFPGGYIKMVGANSPRGFRRVTVRVLLFDELDGAPASAGSEGAPLYLAERRTATVWNRKIMVASTPTVAGVSPIEYEYSHSNQCHFYVPCPVCGVFQVLVFSPSSVFAKPTNGTIISPEAKGFLKFDPDNCTWAHYVCGDCRAELTESDKYRMVPKGQWRPLRPDVTTIAGFHICELYSTFNTTWLGLAQDFLTAKRQREALRVFTNTRLGETFEEAEAFTMSDAAMSERAESYTTLPPKCLLLTAGVDVQADRVECAVWGWGKDMERWLVEYTILVGSPNDRAVFGRLDELLLNKYPHASGATLPITCTFIDSGYATTEVYRFVATRGRGRVFATKGYSGSRAIIGKHWKDKRTGAIGFVIGVDEAKAKVYDALKNPKPQLPDTDPWPGYIHFNRHATPEFFRQLTSERLVTRWKKGFPVRQWELPSNKRNEALDTTVMAYCVVEFLKPNWTRLASKLKKKSQDAGAPEDGADQATTSAPSASTGSDIPRVQQKKRHRPRRHGGWNIMG
jgi:phage terminase large subunit GpA-like protein